jgi:hypothetical protein
MLIQTNRARQNARKGIVLLVVISMLALFAALGLSFVYYANAEAEAARLSTQAQNQQVADVDPELLFSYALGQLIFDLDEKAENGAVHNVASALRGHSLARNMYGSNRFSFNVTPFNGVGRPKWIDDPNLSYPVDRLINHTYFQPDGFVRDPDVYGTTNRAKPTDDRVPANTYYGPNVSYTYADLQNAYLGQMKGDGTILIQSFWRPWTSKSGTAPWDFDLSMDPTDPNYNRIWGSTPGANPDTTYSPKLKYMTLRPLPCYNPNFPAPADATGDVKNVEFGPGMSGGNHDSIWIDLGFPIRYAPNGRPYKPLFAFFIADLDGKVNLNVAGNMRLKDNNGIYSHGSNKGYQVSEINIGQVLPKVNPATNQPEWINLFLYQDGQGLYGRYGADGQPSAAGSQYSKGFRGRPPFYGVHDPDAAKFDPMTNLLSTSEKILMPDTTDIYPKAFPDFPIQTYLDANLPELVDIPWNFNPASGGDRFFPIANMEGLLRYGGTNSPSRISELFGRLSLNLSDSAGDQNKQRWRWITLHSADLARPGITPWLDGTATAGNGVYELGTYNAGGDNFPKTDSANKPTMPTTYQDLGEFSKTGYRGQANTASATRLNLAQLPPYPPADPDGRIDPTKTDAISGKTYATMYTEAEAARQTMVKAIFDRLRFVTMGARPGDPMPNKVAQTNQYNAVRWLAQLAANMVDYADNDDIMTAFQWNPTDATEWVFGTELPRLVVNEVYAEAANLPADDGTMMATKYNLNFWIELLNPFRNEPATSLNPNGTNPAWLQVPTNMAGNGWPVYKVTVFEGDDATLRSDYTKVLGAPDYATLVAADKILEIKEFTPGPMDNFAFDPNYHWKVRAADTRTNATVATKNDIMMMMKSYRENDGWYQLGPLKYDFPQDTAAMPTPTVYPASLKVTEVPKVGTTTPAQGLTREFDANNAMYTPAYIQALKHTVMLRRLANPYAPPDANPTDAMGNKNPNYNPYVTVDYIEDVPTRKAIKYDNAGNAQTPDPIANRNSWVRRHPYGADKTAMLTDQVLATPNVGQPQHTMFGHNAKTSLTPFVVTAEQGGVLKVPFDWLPHLDRAVVNPIELLNVSVFRPHELTQQFYTINGSQRHILKATAGTPIWTDQENRLYRFLEYVDGGWRMDYGNADGRFFGKININTIWDKEVLMALADPNTASNFTSNDITDVNPPAAADGFFKKMIDQRSPSSGQFRDAKPFKGLATAYTSYTSGGATVNEGIEDTILRGTGGFQRTANHPTEKLELLSKIFNNITTRSNVFAVWMTVGFFEVGPDTALTAVVNPGATSITVASTDGIQVDDKVLLDWLNPSVHEIVQVGSINGNTLNLKTPVKFAHPAGAVVHMGLKKEIGRNDNRQVRHRMFAIVDRTGIVMPESPGLLGTPIVANPMQQTVPIRRVQLLPPNRVDFKFQPGMVVDVDSGANLETNVEIKAVNYNTFPATITAIFTKNHGANALISVPTDMRVSGPSASAFIDGAAAPLPVNTVYGNPGPQYRFDHRQATNVVLHFSIIQ